MNNNLTFRLLVTAGILFLTAGCIFGFVQRRTYAALMLVCAFECAVAALNFKNRKE